MRSIATGIAVLVLFATSCTIACLAQQPRLGGYTTTPATGKEVIRAASFAVRAQEKVNGNTSRLELVEILEAESQVVAGMNFRLKLKVKLNGKERTAEAVVWWQAWRKPEPYQLRSWNWK
jgi:hypothetical protein